MWKSLRNAFITGLVILLPLGFTLFVVNLLINFIGAPASKVFFFFLDPALRQSPWVNPLLDIISTLIALLLITFLGLISRYFFGRFIVSVSEKIIKAVPLVGTVYKIAQQIVETFSKQENAVFQKVVLVTFPIKDSFAVGFITGVSKGEIPAKTHPNATHVFVPTTPNPTTGFLLIVPKEDIIELDMSVADGMKLIISGGALMPNSYKKPFQPDKLPQMPA